MALFGGGNAQQGLAVNVSAFGTEETAGKLNRVAGAAAKVDKAASGAARQGTGRLSAGFTRLRSMANGVVGTLAKLGGLLGIGGVFAMSGLISEEIEVERNLRRIAFQGNMGAKELDGMRRAMNNISAATGKGRAEIVAAIDTAMDLGIPLAEAEHWMEKIVLWSDLVGVNVEQATGAIGSIKRAVGDAADIPTIMGMLTAAAQNAGMQEQDLFAMVSKVASQLEGVESVTDIATFFQAIAGLGGEFAGDPGKLMEAFTAINRQLANGDLIEGWRVAGVQGDNAAEMLRSMAQILWNDERALDNANVPTEVLAIATAMRNNIPKMDAMGVAVSKAAGNTDELFAAIEAHKNDPDVMWASTMQELKQAMIPLVQDVLGWVAGHKDEIIAAFKTLGAMAGWVGERLEQLANLLIETWQALKDLVHARPREMFKAENVIGWDEARAQEVIGKVRSAQAEGRQVDPWLAELADALTQVRRERVEAMNPGSAGPRPTALTPQGPPVRVDGEIRVRTVEGVAVDADLRVDGRSAEAVSPG